MAYGAVDRQTWNDEKFRSWDRDTRDVWLYLLTCPHANRIGCFVLDPLYVASDVQIPPERAKECLEFLDSEDRIVWDPAARVVCIKRHLHPDYNPLANKSVATAAAKDVKGLPESPRALRALMSAVENWGRPHYTPFRKALEDRVGHGVHQGVPDGPHVKDQDHDQDQDPDPDHERGNNTPPGGEKDSRSLGNWTTEYVPIITDALWLGPDPPEKSPDDWTLAAELRAIKTWRGDGRRDEEIRAFLLGAAILRDREELGGVERDEGITCARLRYDSPYDVVDQWSRFPHAYYKFEGQRIGDYEVESIGENGRSGDMERVTA